MDTRLYWIWLQQAIGVGSPLSGRLLHAFSHAHRVWEATESELRAAGLSGNALKRAGDKSLTQAEKILKEALRENGWVLTPDDSYYPALLRGIYALPLVLYGRGTMPDLDRIPSVAVVGTRELTAYGRQIAQALGAGLTAGGMILVSGGALGIDTAAMEGALAAGGTVLDIRPCELDKPYPLPNEDLRHRVLQRGALLTECAPGVPVGKPNFLIRNRLLSGMTLGTCVVEAPLASGALITARHAREQGRDVFAVPGDVTARASEGSNWLIQEGAKLVHSAADILEEYMIRFPDLLDCEAAKEAETICLRHFQRGHIVRSQPTVEKPAVKPIAPSTETHAAEFAASVPSTVSSPSAEEKTVLPSAVTPAVCPDTVSPAARRVWEMLSDMPLPIDQLAQKLEWPVPRVLAALTELEINGCARSSAGQSYGRI